MVAWLLGLLGCLLACWVHASAIRHQHQPSAINHQPSPISHQPSATSHQPSATSHQPSATSHQPSTINHQPSAINHYLSTINHQPLAINHQPSNTTSPLNSNIERLLEEHVEEERVSSGCRLLHGFARTRGRGQEVKEISTRGGKGRKVKREFEVTYMTLKSVYLATKL